MEALFSHEKCLNCKGNSTPLDNNAENKTDNNESSVEKDNNDNEEITVKQEQIDELEKEDNEKEKLISNICSSMIANSEILPPAVHFSGKLSSTSSSLASSSETITYSNNVQSDFNLPGCSKTEEYEDSNTTIKNMLRSSSLSTQKKIDSSGKNDVGYKTLLCPKYKCRRYNCSKFPDIGRLLKSKHSLLSEPCNNQSFENCDVDSMVAIGEGTSTGSHMVSGSSDNIQEDDVPSTCSASKLLGMDETKTKSEIDNSDKINFSQLGYPSYGCDDDDTDDEYNGFAWCTCLSPHQDDDEQDEADDEDLDLDDNSRDSSRTWRKRRYDRPSTPHPPQMAKKFCTEGSSSSGSSANEWNSSLSITNTNVMQGPPGVKNWLNKFLSWSKNEKIQAIDALINCCAASQVRHMMKTIEPLFQRDFISLLPKELALTVLGYLEPKDLLRAAQTCRYWRFLADDNLLWKEQCRRIGITTVKKNPRYLPRCASQWKAAYMKQYLIENNWLHKPVDDPIIMRGHDDHVITCLQFYGNRILSGSDDTTLKVWSAVTGKCLRTLVGHSGGVWSSQMMGDLVVSGSTDRTLRVWDANTGKCLKILAGHTSTVRCLHLNLNRVVSGSRDATLRVWSIRDGRCLRVLVGHLAAVRCVQYDGKVVVSGAYDYYVKVWNPENGICLHTLAGHTNRVYSLQFDGIHVVSGSLDTSIRVWDVKSGILKHTLIGHQSLTSGMELHSNILVSGNADSTVKVWDITTGQCLHTLSGPNKHQSAVTCLQSSNRFVITSSDDGTVKLWDVRTGAFIRNLVELGSGGSGGVVWRIRASATKLICAVGSRNGTEETKLLVLDFDIPGSCRKCEE